MKYRPDIEAVDVVVIGAAALTGVGAGLVEAWMGLCVGGGLLYLAAMVKLVKD